VTFEECGKQVRALHDSEDSRFRVRTDGTVFVKHPVTLHDDDSFAVYAWDSNGKKFTSIVQVVNETPHRRRHHHPSMQHETSPKMQTDKPVLVFRRSSAGLKRQKRDWVIPPINVAENSRGPFPAKLVQIKSSRDKEVTVYYSITGPGADEYPEGLFTINRLNGSLDVTKPLDREKQKEYKLLSHAVDENGDIVEDAMDIIIKVTDQNDNPPQFTQQVFKGEVAEGTKPGLYLPTSGTRDSPSTILALHYRIMLSLLGVPPPPTHTLEVLRSTLEVLWLRTSFFLQKVGEYTLIVRAADLEGKGYFTTATAIIKVSDINDKSAIFERTQYEAEVPENAKDYLVARLRIADEDEPHTKAWKAKYKIAEGDEGNYFNISTDSNSNDGLLVTVKGLDFEVKSRYILLVIVENEIPYATSGIPTSTATVTVNVKDENEAPVFSEPIFRVEQNENLAIGQEVAKYKATDPDRELNQKISYYIGNDPADWLSVDSSTGIITSKSKLDRESRFVTDDKYTAIILAADDGIPSATGTGTLILTLLDVNDNAPYADPRMFQICNQEAVPQKLNIIDLDRPPHTFPYFARLEENVQKNWTVKIAEINSTYLMLTPKKVLQPGTHKIPLWLSDAEKNEQLTEVTAQVCDCKGNDVKCQDKIIAAGLGLPAILGILGAILALLLLVLLLLLFLRKKQKVKEPLLPEEDSRDNVFYYDEEGGGEDDQEYDLSQLHRGLDNRPDVLRNDVQPLYTAAPRYLPRPTNPDEIGNFIDENLKAADNDPTAPPYDSLLVFDYEGTGSEAADLSSLNSSSSGGDQDYNCLNEWGPRFKKLADMYGGDEE
uniref:Cadherin-1 n=1 Tax=Latimeria chalumnae TaxID=7897 RepID=H3A8T4_LATCH